MLYSSVLYSPILCCSTLCLTNYPLYTPPLHDTTTHHYADALTHAATSCITSPHAASVRRATLRWNMRAQGRTCYTLQGTLNDSFINLLPPTVRNPATFVTRHANMRSAKRLLCAMRCVNPAFRIALPAVSMEFVSQYLLRRAGNCIALCLIGGLLHVRLDLSRRYSLCVICPAVQRFTYCRIHRFAVMPI
jgi:hypothetical protein